MSCASAGLHDYAAMLLSSEAFRLVLARKLGPCTSPSTTIALATPAMTAFTTRIVVPPPCVLTSRPSLQTQLPSELDQLTSLDHLTFRQAEKMARGALVGTATTCSPVLAVLRIPALKFMYLVAVSVEIRVAFRLLLGLSARLPI